MSNLTTRVFNNGNSQAVRIPQAFKLDTAQVEISKAANGDLVIHPIKQKLGDLLMLALAKFDDDFIAALEEGRNEQLPMQDRAGL
jgi:antitoxin VapB